MRRNINMGLTFDPFLTTLSYSAGVQSNAILEMLAAGDIEKPKSYFLVVNANPGMENSETQSFVERAKQICKKLNVSFIEARGPNLESDLLNFKGLIPPKGGKLEKSGVARFNNPPYWTKDKDGKIGQLKQKCTSHYKIAPMRRAIRSFIRGKKLTYKKYFLIPGLPKVETWIGFTFDETDRVKVSDVKYVTLKYPLIERRLTKIQVVNYYREKGLPLPPRSVCIGCFAHGLSYLKDMCDNRPDDWDRAVAIDENIRDMSHVGIRDQCFMSSTCIPLKELEALDFKLLDDKKQKKYQCNSGVCFV